MSLLLVGVSKRYGRRGPFVLRRVDAALEPGTIVHVQGTNGSGKSTLLRVIAGVSAATRGTVAGRPAGVGFVPERFPPTLGFTPRAYLRHLAAIRRTEPREGLALLDRLGAALYLDTPMSQLSKGTAQKVALAQGLMGPPGLLVLDEAWTGLDAGAQAVLTGAVQQQARQGGIVVLTDHGHRASSLRPDRIWLVDEGTVTEGVGGGRTRGRANGHRSDRSRKGPQRPPRRPRRHCLAERPEGHGGSTGNGRRATGSPGRGLVRPRGTAGTMTATLTALVRYQLADLTASQRWVAPATVYLGFLGLVYASDAGPAVPAFGVTALALLPVAAWLTRQAFSLEDEAARQVTAASAGGPVRVQVALLCTAVVAQLPLILVAVAWAGLANHGNLHSTAGFADGLAVHLPFALLGVGLGAVLSRPLVRAPGAAALAIAALFVASLIVPWSPVLHASRVLETDPPHPFWSDLLPWLTGMLALAVAGAVTAVLAAGRE